MTVDCTHPRSKKAKRCKPCALKALWADPHFRAKKAQSNARTLAKLREDPAFVEREKARQAEGLAKMIASRAMVRPEVVARRALSFSNRKMGWCPPRLRPEYFFLMKNKGLPAAECKRIIMDQIRRETPTARTA